MVRDTVKDMITDSNRKHNALDRIRYRCSERFATVDGRFDDLRLIHSLICSLVTWLFEVAMNEFSLAAKFGSSVSSVESFSTTKSNSVWAALMTSKEFGMRKQSMLTMALPIRASARVFAWHAPFAANRLHRSCRTSTANRSKSSVRTFKDWEERV